MGEIYSIPYYLPMSAIQVTGTKAIATDNLVPNNPIKQESWKSEARIVTVADNSHDPLEAEVKAGALRNTNASMEFTEDGRLTSAGSESSGAIIPLAKGLVSVGIAGAALALAPTPAFLGIGAAVSAGLAKRRLITAPPTPKAAKDPAERRYSSEHPHEYALLKQTADVIVTSEIALAESVHVANTDPSVGNLTRVRRQKMALESAREELGRLRRHFDVWRATLVTTTSSRHERLISLDEVCVASKGVRWSGGSLMWSDDPPEWANHLWDELGVLALVNSSDCTGDTQEVETKGSVKTPRWKFWVDKDLTAAPGVLIRQPRQVTVSVYGRDGDRVTERNWKAELVSTERQSIVDSRSRLLEIPFRSSIFSKRQVAVELSDLGALSKYTHSTTASAKEVGEALSSLPKDVVDALDQAGQAQDKLQAIADHDAIAELERLKREVEHKQKEIELSGLAATEGDYAELKRLEQRASILEAGRKVAVGEATSDEVAGEIAVLKQQLEHAEANRELTTEQLLSEVRIVKAAVDDMREIVDDIKAMSDGPPDDGTSTG